MLCWVSEAFLFVNTTGAVEGLQYDNNLLSLECYAEGAGLSVGYLVFHGQVVGLCNILAEVLV